RPLAIPADCVWEVPGEPEGFEDAHRSAERLVRQESELDSFFVESLQQLGNPLVRPRISRQSPIVEVEKSLQRLVERRTDPHGCQGSRPQLSSAAAYHPANLLFRQRTGRVGPKHLVRAFCQIAPRVDERAVEVEYH